MWFGPGGYHRPLVARDMALLRTRPPGRLRQRLPDRTPANVYNRPENIARVDRAAGTKFKGQVAPTRLPPARRPNDVFAGQDGKVYQRDDRGTWKVNAGRSWKATRMQSTLPSAPPPTARGIAVGPRAEPRRPMERPKPVELSSERRAPTRSNPSARPAPPTIRSTPGNLENEYRARQRGHGTPSNGGEPSARPAPRPEKGTKEGTQSDRPQPPRERRLRDRTPTELRR